MRNWLRCALVNTEPDPSGPKATAADCMKRSSSSTVRPMLEALRTPERGISENRRPIAVELSESRMAGSIPAA